VDIFDPAKRSEIMSHIRGKNTVPELLVFAYLRKNKIYFQRHYRTKSGIRLDIAKPRKKLAVMIDGDFWHGRNYERRKPKLNEFWQNKLETNLARDEKQRRMLEDEGWKLCRVWESDLKRKSTQATVLESVVSFLSG